MSREFALRQILTKLALLDLGWLFLLAEAPAPVGHSQFGDILRIKWDVRVTPDCCHERALRNSDVVKDAAVLQRDRDHMQVVGGLGLIEKKLS